MSLCECTNWSGISDSFFGEEGPVYPGINDFGGETSIRRRFLFGDDPELLQVVISLSSISEGGSLKSPSNSSSSSLRGDLFLLG